MAGLTRASIFAIRKEVTAGTYLAPSAATQFLPLRPGNELSYEPEKLESDELLNDIGAAKAFIGKEIVSGKHAAYLKHSGVEGQEPQSGVLYESLFGSRTVNATEYDTIAGSTVAKAVVDVGEGVNFYEGQALLLKIGSGYEIRNINSITGDNLFFNFNVPNAPGVGINLGKAITYIPVAQGHPTLSTTKYLGNGFAIEASSGNTVTEMSVKADANGFGEVQFSFEGTKYYFNPVIIGATNKYLDFTDDAGTFAAVVTEDTYKTPVELADALQSAMNAASTEDYTVTYSSITGKFTIATSTSAVLSLLWNTGANNANDIGSTIGFLTAADDTLATAYTSDNAQSYAAAYTPSYDNADAIIVKDGELFVGNSTDNICICAQSVEIKVSKKVEDEDCICETSGIASKVPVSRSAEMSVTASLKQYDAALLDALLKNSGVSAMLNIGPKAGGNWIPGKCANFYMQTATVSSYKTAGDSFIQIEFTLSGYVTSSTKDIFLNLV